MDLTSSSEQVYQERADIKQMQQPCFVHPRTENIRNVDKQSFLSIKSHALKYTSAVSNVSPGVGS